MDEAAKLLRAEAEKIAEFVAELEEITEFTKEAVVITRELKDRADLSQLAEAELQRALACITRQCQAQARMFLLRNSHVSAEQARRDLDAANQDSLKAARRVYAISFLLPNEAGCALLKRYEEAIALYRIWPVKAESTNA